MAELQKFLNNKKFPGKLLFAKLWGSRSHNTHLPHSDFDFSGVYIVDTRQILGMDKVDETFQSKEGSEKPDFSFYEVGKFCTLLMMGNPGILEMLFTEKFIIDTSEWFELKSNRHKFLSKKAVNQYIGYAQGQLKRLKNGTCLHTSGCEYSEKWSVHLCRLLLDAERIVDGGEPIVWKEGKEKDFLMNIRNEQMNKKEVEKFANELVNKINYKLDTCALPEIGDKEFLQKWLVDLRLDSL